MKLKKSDAEIDIKSVPNKVKARVFSADSVDADQAMQKLRVLEGHSAFIHFGQSIPVPQRVMIRQGNQGDVIDSLEYRDVISGFHVIPQLNGDIVSLEITPQRDTVGTTGNVNLQLLHTTLSGKLGEWIDAGGIVSDEPSQNSAIGSHSIKARGDTRSILIKVEEIK